MPVLRRVRKTSIGGKSGHIPSELERLPEGQRKGEHSGHGEQLWHHEKLSIQESFLEIVRVWRVLGSRREAKGINMGWGHTRGSTAVCGGNTSFPTSGLTHECVFDNTILA